MFTTAVIVSFVAAAVCIAVLIFLLKCHANWMPDLANHRSLHVGSTPRFGGIAINSGLLAATLALFLIVNDTMPWLFLLAWAGIFSLSLVDDTRGLPWKWRLLFQLICGGLGVIALGVSNLFWLVFSVLVIGWSTNLYNFMDGMDGLAGSMGLIGFGVLAIAGGGVFPLAIAASCLGFLFFNWPKAKVFMGDSGSTVLGFLAASFCVQGVLKDPASFIWPILVFFPFVYDASVTLVRRALQGKRFWEAHREHMYQRAILRGWPAKKVLWGAIGLMLLSGAVALAVRRFGWEIHLASALGLLLLHGWMDRRVGH